MTLALSACNWFGWPNAADEYRDAAKQQTPHSNICRRPAEFFFSAKNRFDWPWLLRFVEVVFPTKDSEWLHTWVLNNVSSAPDRWCWEKHLHEDETSNWVLVLVGQIGTTFGGRTVIYRSCYHYSFFESVWLYSSSSSSSSSSWPLQFLFFEASSLCGVKHAAKYGKTLRTPKELTSVAKPVCLPPKRKWISTFPRWRKLLRKLDF